MAKRRPTLAFDLAEATRHLGEADATLRELIAATAPLTLEREVAGSPYEALLEAIRAAKAPAKAQARSKARSKVRAKATPKRAPSKKAVRS
ncbi:MAG: hypothetical protein FJ144_19920 [Deltaproteobacteria bacterium]|nr:hypothetical protein [Deltaproteobacteria bacterium]